VHHKLDFTECKKNLVYGGEAHSKKNRFFLKNDTILNQSTILISRKKKSSTKGQYQKDASNAGKDFDIEQKLCL
jgi:hypothetical protein